MSYQQNMINAIKTAIWNNQSGQSQRRLKGTEIPEEIQKMADEKYTTGFETGETAGYSTGYNEGYDYGYEAGKAEGGGETLPDADVMEFPLADGNIGRVSTDSKYYDDIAKAINEYGGLISETVMPHQLAECVRVSQQNANIEGEAQGRASQYDEFWDAYQKNPNQIKPPPKINYKYMFGGAGWNSKTFNPKYDMIGSSFERTFHSSSIEEINVAVDMSEISSSSGSNQTFYGATALNKISRFVPPPFAISNAFTNCSSLEVINVEGTITEDISFSNSSKLNEASLSSIVDALAEVTVEKTLTLHSTAKSRLTNEQITTIDAKGWELAW